MSRRALCKAMAAGAVGIASGALLGGCASTSSDQVRAAAEHDDGTQSYTLLYASNNNANSAMYQNVEKVLIDRIREASGGRIVIHEYLASALVKSGEGRNAVLNDICDIVFDSPSWYSGVFPLTTLLEMPLGFKSGHALSYVFRDLIDEFNPAEFDGLKVLCPMCSGPRCLISNAPIRTLDDMRNEQIRASATSAAIIRSWGGIPTTISSSDVYEALQNNLVDGGLFSYESMVGSHYYDVCNYLTDLAPVSTNVVIYMSQSKFDALPADLQETIQGVIDDFFAEVGSSFWANYRDEAVAEARAGNPNLEWILLDDDEVERWVAAGANLTLEYAGKATEAGYDGEAALAWIEERYERYAGQFS